MTAEEAAKMSTYHINQWGAGEFDRVMAQVHSATLQRKFNCIVERMNPNIKDMLKNLGYTVCPHPTLENVDRVFWTSVVQKRPKPKPSLIRYIQDSCGASYPLEDIFNNLEVDQLIQVLQDYKKECVNV